MPPTRRSQGSAPPAGHLPTRQSKTLPELGRRLLPEVHPPEAHPLMEILRIGLPTVLDLVEGKVHKPGPLQRALPGRRNWIKGPQQQIELGLVEQREEEGWEADVARFGEEGGQAPSSGRAGNVPANG